jgi:type I restriction enzyme S subunit
MPPFPEQRRIVEKVGTLMRHILRAEDRLSFSDLRLRASKMSLLGAAFTGDLVDDTEHPCEYVPLDALAERFDYGTSAKSSRSGDVPVLRMGNITDGHIDWEDLVYTSDAEEIEKYALAPGDVLFNRTNSPDLVGKTAVYRGERAAIHAGYLIRIRCGGKLLPDFLNLCLNSPAGRNWCHGVKTDGVSQSNISAAKLKEFPVPAFSVEKQERVVKVHRDLARLADAAQRRVGLATARTTKLTQAILAKAFAGELVPTEAELARREGRSYEPASMLLDRILRETAMSNDVPRRRSTRR